MIEAQNISMDYGSFRAVDNCSFVVNKGQIVGLVGPNGAGKTTIMKILATQLAPSKGTARINGFDTQQDPIEVRKNLGFLPEHAPLYEDMEVREYLRFAGEARGMGGRKLKDRLAWVCENCSLSSMWCKPIGELSKGYKQRVGLAQALIHDPPVLILDEPTSGLDPLQIMEIRQLIKSLAAEKAILFSTHILQEITALTDRAVVINEGKIRADGPLEQLSRKVFPEEQVFVCLEGQNLSGDVFESIPGIKKIREAPADAETHGQCFRITTGDARKTMQDISKMAMENRLQILELYQGKPDLEQVFSAIIYPENSMNEDAASSNAASATVQHQR